MTEKFDRKGYMAVRDTIVVPARRETFEERFLGEDCWSAIRIADEMLDRIRVVETGEACRRSEGSGAEMTFSLPAHSAFRSL